MEPTPMRTTYLWRGVGSGLGLGAAAGRGVGAHDEGQVRIGGPPHAGRKGQDNVLFFAPRPRRHGTGVHWWPRCNVWEGIENVPVYGYERTQDLGGTKRGDGLFCFRGSSKTNGPEQAKRHSMKRTRHRPMVAHPKRESLGQTQGLVTGWSWVSPRPPLCKKRCLSRGPKKKGRKEEKRPTFLGEASRSSITHPTHTPHSTTYAQVRTTLTPTSPLLRPCRAAGSTIRAGTATTTSMGKPGT